MTGGLVLCLGKTGRNFAAGMSGGVAYIFDEDGHFVNKRLNHEMVKVYPLVECDDSEIIEVKELISRHIDYTHSVRGQQILDDWESFSNKFLTGEKMIVVMCSQIGWWINLLLAGR